MSLPPAILPTKRRIRRKGMRAATSTAAALTLVAAELVFDAGAVVRLTFDRAIDVAGLDASQVTVDDADGSAFAYVGVGAGALAGPATVVVTLEVAGIAPAGPTVVNATAA